MRGIAAWKTHISQQLAAQGYQMGWSAVRHAPESVAYRVFDTVADQLWWRDGKGVRQLRANLGQVTGADLRDPALDALTRQGMRSYMRYWCDVFRLPQWDAQRIHSRVDLVGEQHVQTWRQGSQAFIGALPHMGNWDHVGAFAALEGLPILTVAEHLKPESLYRQFVAVRQKLNIQVVALDSGGVLDQLKQGARDGRSVCLLADRDLPRSGVPVQFFDSPASMPPGPALLAILTGLPLHPVSTSYVLPQGARPGQHRLRVHIHDPIEVPAQGSTREKVGVMTQQMAETFAQAITAHPQDWHMLQRLWSGVGRAPQRQRRSSGSSSGSGEPS
jgi:lauroyl/myristoyl acyltransferase